MRFQPYRFSLSVEQEAGRGGADYRSEMGAHAIRL